MNTLVWWLQVVLSAFFILPGIGKLTGSKEKHISDRHIKPDGSLFPIRVLGVLELMGCVGIIVPWLTGIVPILTPLSAFGYGLIMIGGMVNHAKKKEYKMLPMLVAILIMSVVVAYYRFASISI